MCKYCICLQSVQNIYCKSVRILQYEALKTAMLRSLQVSAHTNVSAAYSQQPTLPPLEIAPSISAEAWRVRWLRACSADDLKSDCPYSPRSEASSLAATSQRNDGIRVADQDRLHKTTAKTNQSYFKDRSYIISENYGVTLALMTGALGCWKPLICRSAGSKYKWHVTIADTGLPGRQNRSFVLPSCCTVANVVGFLKHSM